MTGRVRLFLTLPSACFLVKFVTLYAVHDLTNVSRLLERTVKTEAPFTRVAALFGLYIFFYTQIKGTVPPLYSTSHIPIPAGM
jgi:hypothetical protein